MQKSARAGNWKVPPNRGNRPAISLVKLLLAPSTGPIPSPCRVLTPGTAPGCRRVTRGVSLARLFTVSCGICSVRVQAAPLSIGALRCEYLDNPPGIDVVAPRLSWVLESGERGARQSAYQILVASDPESLAQDMGDRWDSGKVASDQSVHVAYAGRPLASRDACHWKVRVWDAEGALPSARRSGYGPLRRTLEGVGSGWARGGAPRPRPPSKPPWFWFAGDDRWARRRSTLPNHPRRARPPRSARAAWFAADNRADLYVNGGGCHQTYNGVREVDITARLVAGSNAIASRLRGAIHNPAGLLAAIEVRLQDGGAIVNGSGRPGAGRRSERVEWQRTSTTADGPPRCAWPAGAEPWPAWARRQPPASCAYAAP